MIRAEDIERAVDLLADREHVVGIAKDIKAASVMLVKCRRADASVEIDSNPWTEDLRAFLLYRCAKAIAEHDAELLKLGVQPPAKKEATP